MALPGANTTVTLERFAVTKDTHGAAVEDDQAPPEETHTEDAMLTRPSAANLYRMTVAGNYARIGDDPAAWQITAGTVVYRPTKVTHRPPIEQLGETEHTLIFVERVGEKPLGVQE